MFVASDAAWRVLTLLAAAIAPLVAPVEAASAHSAAEAYGRLALVIALYAGATFGIRKVTHRYPGVAALATLALLAAPVASAYFSGDRGPCGSRRLGDGADGLGRARDPRRGARQRRRGRAGLPSNAEHRRRRDPPPSGWRAWPPGAAGFSRGRPVAERARRRPRRRARGARRRCPPARSPQACRCARRSARGARESASRVVRVCGGGGRRG